MAEPSQHFYESQRLRLAYWAWGDPDRPPMIMIHGLRDHSRSWDRIAEAFCDRYRVVACDLRGHGDSEWSRGSHYEAPEFMLDLVALIDLLGGKADVVAHSMGGRATLVTAGVFPDRFRNHLIADQLHILNVCFLTPEMRREFGGTAGNIGYNLKLLGGDPLLMATVGEDISPYLSRLDALGIGRRHRGFDLNLGRVGDPEELGLGLHIGAEAGRHRGDAAIDRADHLDVAAVARHVGRAHRQAGGPGLGLGRGELRLGGLHVLARADLLFEEPLLAGVDLAGEVGLRRQIGRAHV